LTDDIKLSVLALAVSFIFE